MSQKPVESGQLYQHRWLYTFLPKTEDLSRHRQALYLLAYCPTCDSSLASRIPVKEGIGARITKPMGVPRFGCVSPIEGL